MKRECPACEGQLFPLTGEGGEPYWFCRRCEMAVHFECDTPILDPDALRLLEDAVGRLKEAQLSLPSKRGERKPIAYIYVVSDKHGEVLDASMWHTTVASLAGVLGNTLRKLPLYDME